LTEKEEFISLLGIIDVLRAYLAPVATHAVPLRVRVA
jgi:hypothetical protein